MSDFTVSKRAEIIIGFIKLRQLESDGLTVIEKSRLDALENLHAAAEAFTTNWGRSKGGTMYRADEPEGTALPLLEALESLEDMNDGADVK